MVLARIYPEAEKGGRGKKSEAKKVQETCRFSHERLDSARAALRHSQALADSVIKGDVSLDEAMGRRRAPLRPRQECREAVFGSAAEAGGAAEIRHLAGQRGYARRRQKIKVAQKGL